jgi:hypothetical protein
MRFGMEPEAAGGVILEGRLVVRDDGPVPPGTFALERAGGATTVTLEEAVRRTGREPVLPQRVDGLELYGVTIPHDDPNRTVVAFAEGLTWLTVAEGGGALAPGSLSPAEEVELPDGGSAVFEPAGDEDVRRVTLRAHGVEMTLESNLPQERLFDIAASLPGTSAPPEDWGEGIARAPVEAALAAAGVDERIMAGLPEAYRVGGADIVRFDGSVGVTIHLRGPDGAIRLHLERSGSLPPPAGAEPVLVGLGDGAGRWSADLGTLEWVADGVYRSLAGPALSLEEALSLAGSLGAGS